MDYTGYIKDYFNKLKSTIDKMSVDDISCLMNILEEAREQGKQIFIMGNGGSAATASHSVCDFNKGVSYGKDKKRYKFICLNDNLPTMMAYANDISYSDVFVEPLKNFFNDGDIVIGISGSGNSKNVIKAIEWANLNGGVTVGISGYDGGKMKPMCKFNVHVPVMDMQITEDIHMVLVHCIMKILGGEHC